MQRLIAAGFALALVTGCGSSGGSSGSSGATSTGGDGSGTSSGGDTGTGTSPGSGTPGDFSAIWQQKGAQVQLTDPKAPAAPVMGTLKLQSKVTYQEYGQDFEIFEQLKDDQLVIYANAGGSAYYRVTRPALKGNGTYSVVNGSDITLFEIKGGLLQETQIRTLAGKAAFTTITFEKYSGDFPPADWPTDVIEADLAEVLQ